MRVRIRLTKPSPAAVLQGLCYKGQILEMDAEEAARKVKNGVAEYVTEPETAMIEAPPNRMMPRGKGRKLATR